MEIIFTGLFIEPFPKPDAGVDEATDRRAAKHDAGVLVDDVGRRQRKKPENNIDCLGRIDLLLLAEAVYRQRARVGP